MQGSYKQQYHDATCSNMPSTSIPLVSLDYQNGVRKTPPASVHRGSQLFAEQLCLNNFLVLREQGKERPAKSKLYVRAALIMETCRQA